MHAFLPLDNYCTCGDANGPCCAILPQHQGMRRAALGCLAAAAALAPAKRDWRCAFDAAFAGDFDNYAQVAAERARGVAAADRAGHEHVHCCLRPLRAAEAAGSGEEDLWEGLDVGGVAESNSKLAGMSESY